MNNHYEDEDYEEEPYEVRYDNDQKTRQYVTKDGKATAVFPNQDVYSGPYKNKKRNGKGTYKWTRHNAAYVGEYVDGLRDGTGTFTYPDGSSYTGQWKKNNKHGHGVYTYANGDKYCGQWENNVRSGQGTYIYFASRTQLTGEWVDGNCIDGKLWYCDDNLLQAHQPFSAVVKNGSIAKYNEPVKVVDRVIFKDDEETQKQEEDKTEEKNASTDEVRVA